jgi:hypothetical protein
MEGHLPLAGGSRGAAAMALRSVNLDRVITDTVRVAANGVDQVETVRHRLGDYFAEIRIIPDSQGDASSFRLLFHRRPNAGRFWKDLMVNVLQEIERAPQKQSIEPDAKTDAVGPDRTKD